MIPHSFRNNNPGNIVKGAAWQGLVPGPPGDRFCTFDTPEDGFRALVKLLHNYIVIYQDDTVEQIVNKFAPPVENNTAAYIADVAQRCGVNPDTKLGAPSAALLFKLAKAIAHHETGSWEPYWTDAQLTKGMALAGFPLSTSTQGAIA
jgi:hypothetical protein